MDGMDAVVMAVSSTVLAILGLAGGVYAWVNPSRTAAERLAEFTGAAERGEGGGRPWAGIARSAARLSSGSEEELGALRKWLTQAGYRGRHAVEVYSATRTVGALALALFFFLLFPKDSLAWMAGSALSGATAGYYVPMLWVSNRRTHRQKALMHAFPDTLDLLVSTVEAGLGLDAAFRRVAEEMETAAPELSRELQTVNHEVNGGVPRIEALRRLDDRTGLDEVGALVNVLVQAERFGTSVARALRVHSEHIRTRRMQTAETKAAQVSPKLTIVMILFILPCLIVILLGPAAVGVKNIVMPTAAERAPE